ncbi:MAG TPA: hypothetical protein VN643_11815 [Pyrinomonadaceae bacterium]|nr:hypothetical protein [Pyrinomonadaceae bacterium]
MTEEEYLKMRNLLNSVIEQQATFAENQAKVEARTTNLEIKMERNAEAIAALLTLAQMHEQEITKINERLDQRFSEVAQRFHEIGEKTAETDERINALVNVVERYISKN